MSEPATTTNASNRSTDDVRRVVHGLVKELAPEPPEEFSDQATLVDELAFHSLALLELAFALEDEFDLEPIDEETARNIVTVQDLVDHVTKQLGIGAE